MFKLFADHVREFTCGKLYYRTFLLDEAKDILYVGAMWVFTIWVTFPQQNFALEHLHLGPCDGYPGDENDYIIKLRQKPPGPDNGVQINKKNLRRLTELYCLTSVLNTANIFARDLP